MKCAMRAWDVPPTRCIGRAPLVLRPGLPRPRQSLPRRPLHRADFPVQCRGHGMAPPLLNFWSPESEEKTMTDDPLLATFFEEAEELLAAFEAGLLQLE